MRRRQACRIGIRPFSTDSLSVRACVKCAPLSGSCTAKPVCKDTKTFDATTCLCEVAVALLVYTTANCHNECTATGILMKKSCATDVCVSETPLAWSGCKTCESASGTCAPVHVCTALQVLNEAYFFAVLDYEPPSCTDCTDGNCNDDGNAAWMPVAKSCVDVTSTPDTPFSYPACIQCHVATEACSEFTGRQSDLRS